MLTEQLSTLTSPTVIIDQDLDQQAAGLYRILKELLDSLTITESDVDTVVFGGGRNIYSGHGQFETGQSTETITMGITLPSTDYAVLLTLGDGFSEDRINYANKTTTTFDAELGGNAPTTIDFSWIVAY